MGKDRTIKLIANLIGKSTAHKILIKYTNMPESINHMSSEIDNYRGQLSEYITQYNWNTYDKQKIKKEAEKSLNRELKENHFTNVIFPSSVKIKFLSEAIREFF